MSQHTYNLELYWLTLYVILQPVSGCKGVYIHVFCTLYLDFFKNNSISQPVLWCWGVYMICTPYYLDFFEFTLFAILQPD